MRRAASCFVKERIRNMSTALKTMLRNEIQAVASTSAFVMRSPLTSRMRRFASLRRDRISA